MGKEVQRIRTEVSETQMVQAIMGAWNDLFHTVPTKEQVSLIMAQNALETGGRKSMWNNNVGNIKASTDGPYDYFYLRGPEQTAPGKWEQLRMTFRAYPTLEDGVKDYLNLLSKNKRYASAWAHIQTPNPSAFSKALKEGGYYTGNESDYTKHVSSLYNKFNKSQSYEAARSGTSEEAGDMFSKYMEGQKDKDIWEHIGLIDSKKAPVTTSPTPANTNYDEVLDSFLRQTAASDKKLYKKFLPQNSVLIRVQSGKYTDSVEFARILCAALDEELLSDAFIYTDGEQVEVECGIHGPELACFEAVKQLSASLCLAFKKATSKIGGVDVKTYCFMDKRSSYQEISLKVANIQRRNFLLKFI